MFWLLNFKSISPNVENVSLARRVLQDCILDVANWCSSRRLQLNASKTELIWFGSRFPLKKLTEDDLTLQFDSGSIHPVSVVRDLGVMLDCELSMKQHVIKVASSCFYQICRLKQISRLKEVTAQLVSAFILSPRLLQCPACGVAMRHNRPITASPECSSSSGAQPPSSRSCDTEATSLVASCKQNRVLCS